MSRRRVCIGQRGHACPHRWPESELPSNPTTARPQPGVSQPHRHARTHTHTHSQPRQPANDPCLQDVLLFAANTSRQTESMKRLQSSPYLAFTSFRETMNMSGLWEDYYLAKWTMGTFVKQASVCVFQWTSGLHDIKKTCKMQQACWMLQWQCDLW